MVIKRYWFVLIILVVVLLTSCSSISYQIPNKPVKLDILHKLGINFKADKCVYSSSQNVLFVKEKDTNFIHIFKDGRQINKIGGIGFEKQQFNQLSDIALAPDGNLYTLDSASLKITKFDIEGKWIAKIDLNNFSEPTLFDVTINDQFYIYDSNKNEIFIFDPLKKNSDYSFGKFQLSKPTNLKVSKNQIIINNSHKNHTLIYDTLGKFISKSNEYVQSQRGIKFILKNNYFVISDNKIKFAISAKPWLRFYMQRNYCLLISNNEIWIAALRYR